MDKTLARHIIVLGAGVIGLSTAILVQEKGYDVTIVAEAFSSDSKSIKYASHWAGAHHVSHAGTDSRQTRFDHDTLKVMWEMTKPGHPAEKCFMRLNQEEYHGEIPPQPDSLEYYPDFRDVPRDRNVWPKRAVHGVEFTSLNIDTPLYMEYLMTRFTSNGGSLIRATIQHIDELVEGGLYPFDPNISKPKPPMGIIACPGLGARNLGGVEDKDVYPIRGQTVLVKAPWVRFGRTFTSLKDKEYTYIIPRGPSGTIVLGGTLGPDDWFSKPRPESMRDVLERAFAIGPELAPPEIRALREPTVEDLLPIVIEEGCGLRPARRDGVRVEGETRNGVPVVYHYGHGGFGYMSSWGSAAAAVASLESLLKP